MVRKINLEIGKRDWFSISAAIYSKNHSFAADGELRQIDPSTGLPGDQKFEFAASASQSENQRRYEAIGDVITEHVYELLEQNGLQRLYLNPNDKEGAFVFSTKTDLSNTDKLLILIHGSGVVRAGQWSRSLIMNHSLDKGTQLPYIRRAKALGYEILITNTNHNYRPVNGELKRIPGSENAPNHGRSVWDKFISPARNLRSIGIVAHSYGGIVTLDLAEHKLDEFKKLVFGVAFTDSVHSFGSAAKGLVNVFRPVGSTQTPAICFHIDLF